MKKTLVLILSIATIIMVSSAIVFSHPERWGSEQRGWNEDKLVNLEGKVIDVGRPTAVIRTDDKEYILHLGPFWYRQDKEYPLKEGQTVKITGIVEEIYGRLHIYPRTIESDGKLLLNNEYGFHGWGGYCHGYDDHEPGWHHSGYMHGWGGHGHMMW
jgi:hypothetical protein